MIGLILALLAYFALSFQRVVGALRARVPGRLVRTGYVAAPLLIYLFAALATGAGGLPAGLAVMAAYLFIPALLQALRPAGRPRLDLLDILTVLIIWFPLEFDLLPDVSVAGLPVTKVLAVVNGLLIYLVIAPFEPRPDGTGALGYTFRLAWRDLRTALGAWLAFGIVGIPLGLVSRFLALNPAAFEPGRWAMMLFGGYLFTAVPEEILFRGVIQNMLERRFPQWPELTLGLAAVFFGLTHLNNATPGYPVPNLMYATMATLAGLAYGFVWRRTGKVTASAVTHALVNFVWGVLLGA